MRRQRPANKNALWFLPPAQLGSGHDNNCHDKHNDGCLSHENSFTGGNRQHSTVKEIEENKIFLKPVARVDALN